MERSELPSGLTGTDLFAVAEASPDFVALARLDNTVAYVNPAGRRLVGLGSLAEAVAHPITDFLTEDGLRASTAIEQPAVIEHGFWQGRSTLRHFGTGHAIPVEITSFLVRDTGTGEPRMLATFQRDITDQVLLEQRLREAEKFEAVGRLAGGVAHDFNNILTVVMGYADLAAGGRGAGGLRRAMDELLRAAQQGAQLTKQLLSLARQDDVRPALLDLNTLVADMLPVVRTLVGGSVTVRTALAPGIGAISADRTQIGQILLNLCGNARDAMPPHGGSLDISTSERNGHVALVVRDDGAGIAPEHLDLVTEPFFTTKEDSGGTGLGLATVRSIVDAAGGTVRIGSELGAGTTVTVALPRAAASAEQGPGLPAPNALHQLHGTETVLLVEDDAAVRKILSTALAAHGYAVLLAADGEEALEALARAATLDVVVTDMVMPRSGGAIVAQRARERDPALPVIVISGNTQTDDARALAEGDVEFLPKPFAPSHFLRVVRRVLDARA
jgi:PAS domain S-box-containing protein